MSMGEKNCPHIENDMRTISKRWDVTENGVEMATITMSVAVAHGIQVESIEKILQAIADDSHTFYLEVGNALKAEP